MFALAYQIDTALLPSSPELNEVPKGFLLGQEGRQELVGWVAECT